MVSGAPSVAIRPDIHQRFMTLVARAEAKVKAEQDEMRRRLTPPRPEAEPSPAKKPPRPGSARVTETGV